MHGTINDLAMMGARPVAISAAFVLEEGLSIDVLREVVADMAEAAAAAGVPVVTGDTKVVDRGAADGMYITTAGVGAHPGGPRPRRRHVRRATSSSPRGRWATTAPPSCWPGATSRSRPTSPPTPRPSTGSWTTFSPRHPPPDGCRDATRGGVGTVCNELARDANVTVVLDEPLLPVRPEVAAACELLGIDPLYVANEGKLMRSWRPRRRTRRSARYARAPARPRRGAHRRDPRRTARHRGAAHASWAAPGSSTCSSVTRSPYLLNGAPPRVRRRPLRSDQTGRHQGATGHDRSA